ncbi:MAG: tetratricopeptide repeat protein [Verrucomicrobiae bacterium]|nr:tetratricopeptide repeat protein [Verrucomicrobiae bacterium]
MAEAPKKPTESDHPANLDALAASEAHGVVDTIERHRTKILAAIAISAIVLCGVLITAQLKRQKHLAAASAYTSAVTKGEIAALDGVLVEFPGTVPAGNALLSKAELQIDQGKPADAVATLERFLSEFSTHPRYAQGLFALANLHHQSGDAQKAKEFYEKVITAQPDGELSPLALIRLGDLALEAGDKVTADARYQESFTLHPGNPFFEYAEEKIALLKVGNPPEVDKPAPPAPVEAPKTEAPAPAPAKPEAPKAATPAPAPAKPEAPKAATPAPAPAKSEAPKAATPAPAPAPAQ